MIVIGEEEVIKEGLALRSSIHAMKEIADTGCEISEYYIGKQKYATFSVSK